TAFCPTTVACSPAALQRVLDQVRRARETPDSQSARVLPAHLESNFISPEYKGAQPLGCLRSPRAALGGRNEIGRAGRPGGAGKAAGAGEAHRDEFDGAEVLSEIERGAPDIGIVTVAPEIDGGLDLIDWLTAHGLRVSLGHSGATYEQAQAAIVA